MEKVFGAEQRHDSLIVHGTKKAVLIFGYGEENGQGYDYRHIFDHVPTKEEVVEVIHSQIDADTDQKILSGCVWNGKNVWLSAENQRNFSEAQRSAMIDNGAKLPITFKIGQADGEPVYHQFQTLEELTEFYLYGVYYIQNCIGEGWVKKDAATTWVKTLNLKSSEA